MKKMIKLFPVAVGMMALTGCVNDDIPGLSGSKADFSGKYVLKVNVEDEKNEEGVTRAYWDATTSGTNLTFAPKDILRVFDGAVQKYDNFVMNDWTGENDYYFVLDPSQRTESEGEELGEGTLRVDNAEYANALYAEPGCISYAGWNDGHKVALVKINETVGDYSEGKSVDGSMVYKYAVPMWGEVTPLENAEEAVQNAEKAFKVSMKWLSARAKVEFKNGAGAEVVKVQARAVKFKNGVTDEQKKKLAAALKNANSGDKYESTSDGTTLGDLVNLNLNNEETEKEGSGPIVEGDETHPLSGVFEAMLEKDGQLQKIQNPESAFVDAEYAPVVSINTANAETKETYFESYTSIVYLPIVPAKYEMLLFEYEDKNGNWHFIRLAGVDAEENNGEVNLKEVGFEMNRAETVGKMLVVKEMTAGDIQTLSDLQKVITDAANCDADVVIDVTLANDIAVEFAKNQTLYTLTLPENFTHHVTLNIMGGEDANYNFIQKDAEGRSDDELVIAAKSGATGTLTINLKENPAFEASESVEEGEPEEAAAPEFKLPIVIGENMSNVTLELNGTVDVSDLNADAEEDASKKLAVRTETNKTLKQFVLTGAINGGDAEIKTVGNVTLNEVTLGTGVVLTADDVLVAGKVTGNVKAASATVTGSVENLTITGTTVNVNGGKVTNLTYDVIEEAAGAAEVPANITINTTPKDEIDNTVETLTVNKNATVALNNGVVKKIDLAEGTTSTIESQGLSYIYEVTGKGTATIKSKYTKEAGAGIGYGDKADNRNNGLNEYGKQAVYTVAHLIKLIEIKNTSVYSHTGFSLKANEYDLDGYDCAGIPDIANSGADCEIDGATLDGTKPVIKNVKLTGNGFINQITTARSVSIKGIKFQGIAYNKEAETNASSGVGALIGTVGANAQNVVIEDVEIYDNKIYGNGDSHDLGGMIGTVEGKVTIKGGILQVGLKGYYNLGGVVGNVVGEVKIEKNGETKFVLGSKNGSGTFGIEVTNATLKSSETQVDENAGKVGLIAGTIGAEGKLTVNEPTVSVNSSTIKADTDWFYGKQYTVKDKKILYFKGGYTPYNGQAARQYWVGYCESENAKYYKGTNEVKNGSLVNNEGFNIFE